MSNQVFNKQTVTETHKSCSKCNTLKVFSEFNKDKQNPKGKGYAYYCKECANLKARDHHSSRKDSEDYISRRKDVRIRKTYGIDLHTYNEKLISQGCMCAICKVSLPMSGNFTHLDHDHKTGKLRSFLCTNCNRGLGHFQDNKEIIMSALKYLQSYTDDEITSSS